MIAPVTLPKALLVCAAMLCVSSCGNDVTAQRSVDAAKNLAGLAKARLSKADGEPSAGTTPDPVAMIEHALEVIPDAPLQFILLEKTNDFAISSIYGVNGSHVTWVSPDRRTLTFDDGVLVATRGFGSDIMSVEDGGGVRLIAARENGVVTKTYRFLSRSEVINRLDATCTIVRGEPSLVESGEISAQTVLMTESCATQDGFEFKNSYWVDTQGRVIQSVQWVSGAVGRLVTRRLRY